LSRIGLKDLETNEHDIDAIQLLFLQLPLFKKTRKDLEDMSLRDKIIKRAYDELDRFSWSEKELNNYESVEMKKTADEAVFEKGIEKGVAKEKREIALKMLKRGRPVEDTGLSVGEIESLKK
jgi:predicted transposase/invertase (TIGR01784 family)